MSANQVAAPYDSSAESASVNVFTGLSDKTTLTQVAERAYYDTNSLQWQPMSSSDKGLLFEDALGQTVKVESSIRQRPTAFKGAKQLDIQANSQDQHWERQTNPSGWASAPNGKWASKSKAKGKPFVGYPNPDLFYMYTDSVNTSNIQNLNSAQMAEALRGQAQGDFNYENYFSRVGSLMKSTAISQAERDSATVSRDAVMTSNGGINSDPRLIEKIQDQYEDAFALAKRLRVNEAENDTRYIASTPGPELQEELFGLREEQESVFSKINQFGGVFSSYTQPEIMKR